MHNAHVMTGTLTDAHTVTLDEALPFKPMKVRVVVELLGVEPQQPNQKELVKDQPVAAPTPGWQEWAKERAKNAPSIAQVHEISRKVKVSVTQMVLEDRRGE
jgi:hypothetical protein